MKKVFIISLVFCLFAAFLTAQDEATTIITQGQFAVKLTQLLKAQTPEGAIDEQSAITFLESIGIAPGDGWNISASLTEGVMAELVKVVGVQLSPIDPHTFVTVAKANVILRRYAKVFKEYYLIQYNADNSTDASIVDDGAIPAPSVSPGRVH